jgi:hypothetical protein
MYTYIQSVSKIHGLTLGMSSSYVDDDDDDDDDDDNNNNNNNSLFASPDSLVEIAGKAKITVFWDVRPCIIVDAYLCFRENYCL